MEVEQLPHEVAVSIVTLLPAQDLCTLSECSRLLHHLCSSEEVWELVYKRRWPATAREGVVVAGGLKASEPNIAQTAADLVQDGGWRVAYRRRAAAVAEHARALVAHVFRCACNDSLEVFTYHDALAMLRGAALPFADVRRALLAPKKHSVLVALIAVHYACHMLAVPGPEVAAALEAAGVAERQVCLRWWSMGSMGRGGFRLRDDMRTATLSLRDIALASRTRDSWLLPLLERGTVYEILRIQISADFTSSAWVGRDMHSQR